MAAGCQLLISLPIYALHGGMAQPASFVITALFSLMCAYVFVRAAIELKNSEAVSNVAWPWLGMLAGAMLFGICFTGYSMSSTSMKNTLLTGDCLLVNRAGIHLGRLPERDELLAFRYPMNHQEIYIKRVAGIPGDRLRIVDKQLYRNGTGIVAPYITHTTSYIDSYRDNFPSEPETRLPAPALAMLHDNVRDGEVVVPPGKYFVLGDNRDDSADSRYWGFVSMDEIVGKPILIYGSNDLESGSGAKGIASIFNTRWDRLLKPL